MYNEETRKLGDELDLKLIFKEIYEARYLLILVTFLVTALTAIYSLTIPNVYKSTAKLEPVVSENNSSMGGLGSILGSFDSSLNQKIGKTQQALEIIESKDFFEKLYSKDDFLLMLMAYKTSLTGHTIDSDIYDSQSSVWVDGKPSFMEAYRKFYNEHFSKSAPKDTPFITIGINHYSQENSKRWLDMILDELDSYLKDRDSKISEETIEFLQERISKSNQTNKMYLTQLLVLETQKLIQTKVDSYYAFTIIDSPRVPEFKESPKRAIICLTAAGLTFFISFFFVTILSVLNRRLAFSLRKFKFSLTHINR